MTEPGSHRNGRAEARERARLAAAFGVSFHRALEELGCEPRELLAQDRSDALSTDGVRELMEPAYWAVLEGQPGRPTVLAEVDMTPSGMERSVAKYVWWSTRSWPFWSGPSYLITGLTASPDERSSVHRTLAVFLGHELTRAIPDLRHVIVEVFGDRAIREAARLLGHRAAFELVPILAETPRQSIASR
jgi:hypothetical protein